MTSSFGINLSWVYDPTLTGKLLYSKYYQNVIYNTIPESQICSGSCLYCGTSYYCTSCTQGMYNTQGTCYNSAIGPSFMLDAIEREYKAVPASLNPCYSSLCLECNDTTLKYCKNPIDNNTFCIRNTMFFNSSCFLQCPATTFSNNSVNCSVCPNNCSACSNSTTCTACLPGYLLNSTQYCVTTNCGNGIIELPEDCDDWNQLSGDGCSQYCQIEDGFSCSKFPSGYSHCTPICGDGKFFGLGIEQCDDGNTIQGDGCDPFCNIESGWWCTDGSPTQKECLPLRSFAYPRN